MWMLQASIACFDMGVSYCYYGLALSYPCSPMPCPVPILRLERSYSEYFPNAEVSRRITNLVALNIK